MMRAAQDLGVSITQIQADFLYWRRNRAWPGGEDPSWVRTLCQSTGVHVGHPSFYTAVSDLILDHIHDDELIDADVVPSCAFVKFELVTHTNESLFIEGCEGVPRVYAKTRDERSVGDTGLRIIHSGLRGHPVFEPDGTCTLSEDEGRFVVSLEGDAYIVVLRDMDLEASVSMAPEEWLEFLVLYWKAIEWTNQVTSW